MDCSELRDDLLDVLYGEASEAARERVLAHVASCGACRDELAALRALRAELQRWKAPEARPLPRHGTLPRPVLFLAAAAALLLASGALLGLVGSELRYEEGRFAFRLGRGANETGLRRALEEQETRHQREMAELRALVGSSVARRAPDGEALLRQVSDLVRESEARQAQKLEASLLGLAERTEARRRYDLARIGAGLAYLDGKNGQQLSRTTELMGYMLEASQKRGER
jgi:hypothetical protein